MLQDFLFPTLNNSRWGRINLDLMARLCFPEAFYRQNPCLEPVSCDRWLKALHEAMEVDYTYGGLYESREHLWLGHSDMQPLFMTHLGIDYNVPEGTPVHCPINGTVFSVFHDRDQNGGWGGRIVIKQKDQNAYLIIGHLDKTHLPLNLQSLDIIKGDYLGVVANMHENGNWYQHLHVQGINGKRIVDPEAFFKFVDGYAKWKPDLYKLYPNPEDF